jgi:ribosome-associated protein
MVPTAQPQESERKMSNPTENETGKKKALLCAQAAIDKKAENLRILDVSDHSGFTDYFVICSGTSDRQVQAIADAVGNVMEVHGHEMVSAEGFREGRWVLMDFGDVVVHIFLDALRDYYDLERLWKDAPRIPVPSEYYGPTGSRLN